MTMPARAVLVLLLLVVAAGCRQPDGPMPISDGDTPDKIGEMGRGIVVSREPDEPDIEEWLAGDLEQFVDDDARGPQVTVVLQELADAVAGAVGDLELEEETTAVLADTLWLVVAGRELSTRQRTEALERLRASVVATGASPSAAENVVDRAAVVQDVLSLRSRRWYEVF